jgi:nitronate monooxygenase
MWPKSRLTELLRIEHPIILAPMAGIGTGPLAAAVCAGGGLGSIGCALQDPETAATAIRHLQELTDKPINVNFFCHRPPRDDIGRARAWQRRLVPYYAELGVTDDERPASGIAPFGDAMCTVVEETRPQVVSFHFGLPNDALVERIKAVGCRVMSSATTVEEALWLEARGADLVIAQGCEAGGHRATFLGADLIGAAVRQPGTLALIPQVVDALHVPVVAAGGIADGRGIAAVLALGAAGAQIGTAYLLCPEASTSQMHRDALRCVSADSTVLTNVFTGRPARVIGNRLPTEVGPLLDEVPDFPLAGAALGPLKAAAEARNANDFTPLWCGQAAALGRALPAKTLTAKLAREALERLCELSGIPGTSPHAAARERSKGCANDHPHSTQGDPG